MYIVQCCYSSFEVGSISDSVVFSSALGTFPSPHPLSDGNHVIGSHRHCSQKWPYPANSRVIFSCASFFFIGEKYFLQRLPAHFYCRVVVHYWFPCHVLPARSPRQRSLLFWLLWRKWNLPDREWLGKGWGQAFCLPTLHHVQVTRADDV